MDSIIIADCRLPIADFAYGVDAFADEILELRALVLSKLTSRKFYRNGFPRKFYRNGFPRKFYRN